MVSQWLSWLNCAIIGSIGCLVLASGMMWFQRPDEIICAGPVSKQCRLPKSAFTMQSAAYKEIGGPLLALQESPPSLQVPDLRQHLVYYGKNGRPDARSAQSHLHFSFMGSKTVISILPNEKLYLVYDKKIVPSHYTFSSYNVPTSLWIEATAHDNEALVKVFMKTDKGELITEPETYSQFKLNEKEFIRYAGASWEIGGWRVDGTLLARQKARWFGCDCFLERHGGDEYKEIIGKHRIDFGEAEDVYSVFVGVGSCLIWDGQHWKESSPSEDSLKHPLLVVKKIDERLMTFELWDVEGKGKILLNILKSNEPWLMQNPASIQQTFKFVGARTRTQCVFEINQERMLIKPSDWLLLTNKGWKKLTTEEEIDQYVKRKMVGTLFVFEGLARKDDRQVMLGSLYNPTRSDFQAIELPIQQVGGMPPKVTSAQEGHDEDKMAESLNVNKINLDVERIPLTPGTHPSANVTPTMQQSLPKDQNSKTK